MVFAFGNQSDVRPILAKVFDVSYFEFIHSIPYVQACDGSKCRGPFIYSPRLYLDKALPVALGWAYGLKKHLVARYKSADGSQEIGRAGSPMVDVQWKRGGAFVPPTALPHFAPVAQFLKAQPLIGAQELAGGAFECSRFDWGLDTHATVAPATGLLRLHTEYGAPFAEGREDSFIGVDTAPTGAFELRTKWRMSVPVPCALLPASPSPPPPERKRRIAVLGGGLGAMSAAWYLSKSSEGEEVAIDVYQMGHRLGGKTANGKNETAGYGGRNEEHGLHFFMGWYNNAFELLREISEATSPRDAASEADDDLAQVAAGAVPAWLEGMMGKASEIAPSFWPYGTPYGTPLSNDNYTMLALELPSYLAAPGGHHLLPSPLELFLMMLKALKRFVGVDSASHVGAGSSAADGAAPPLTLPLAIQHVIGLLDGAQCGREALSTVSQGDAPLPAATMTDHLTEATQAMHRVAARMGVANEPDIASMMRRVHGARAPTCKLSVAAGVEREEGGEMAMVGEDCADLRTALAAFEHAQCALHVRMDTVLPFTPSTTSLARQHPQLAALAERHGLDSSAIGRVVGGVLTTLDYFLAAAVGLLSDRGAVLRHGFGTLDKLDMHEWLLANGMRQASIANPFLVAAHDLIFGYKLGENKHPVLAAGTGTQCLLNMFFNGHGSFFYHFMGGTADVIFTPLYRALRKRGVRFHFFHRVTSLDTTASATDDGDARRSVDRIDIAVQATPKAGEDSYDPLTADGKWPSAPQYEQLVEGAQLRRNSTDLEDYYSRWPAVRSLSLRRGVDFDDVVLGIPVGALRFVTPQLAAASPRWAQMIKMDTVATTALQLWVDRSVGALGAGSLSPHNRQTTLIGFAEPFDTWADMTHLLRYEHWQPSTSRQADDRSGEAAEQTKVPQSLAYFCGPFDESADAAGGAPIPAPLSDHEYPERALRRARQQAAQWIETRLPRIWPAVAKEPRGAWSVLAGAAPRNASDPLSVLDTQYVRANVNPAERYVLSPAGQIGGTRLHPARAPFANLLLAGDWTLTGINSGCAEAAITSGMLVARAVVGEPRDDVFTDYFDQFGPPVP